MGLRFRKSIKLMPGVRINLSKSGLSTTIGKRGASVNIGPQKSSATIGIPGTGLSYTAHSKSSPIAAAKEPGATPTTHYVQHMIETGDDNENSRFNSAPHETSYRIAALLASGLIAGADVGEIEARIAGLLPERLPNRMSSPQYAKLLTTYALGRDGTSYQGTAAVRRALSKAGQGNIEVVADAVNAVRASMKVRAGGAVDTRLPVEWYRDGGELKWREFEASSLRAKIPDKNLGELHAAQVEIGRQRTNNPALTIPPRAPLLILLINALFKLTIYALLAVLSAAVTFFVIALFRGGH